MVKHFPFLDNLRTTVIVLAVLCTALSGFMVYPDVHAFVPATTQHVGFDAFCNGIIPVILAVLFFISGFCNASTLRIHLVPNYVKQKWVRLGLPWLVGIMILAPELAYLSFISHGGSHDISTFYWVTYWYDAFTQGQYWFLSVLLVLTLGLALAKQLRHSCLKHKPAGPVPPLVMGAFYVTLSVALEAAYLLGGNHWFNVAYLLTFRLDYAVLAVFFFLGGVYAEKHRWFSPRGYMPELLWFYTFIIVFVVYCINIVFSIVTDSSIISVMIAALSLSGTLGLIAAFKQWGNSNGPKAMELAGLSYAFYFVSEPFAQNTAFFLNPLDVPAIVKIILILAITFIYGYLVSKYALKYIPSFQKQ